MDFERIKNFEREDLIKLIDKLESELTCERQKNKRLEEAAREKEFHLLERNKELKGIFRITNLVNEPGNSVEYVLTESLKILTASYLYPDIACGRINFGERSYHSENFVETKWRQSIEMDVQPGKDSLDIDIFYLKECPEMDEGPFLKEERNLLETIGKEVAIYLKRKHIEEELDKKNQNFELIFNSVKDAVFIHDLEGEMIEINKEAWKRLGYSRRELLNMAVFDFDDPDQMKKTPSIIDQLEKSGFYKGETTIITKEGNKIPSEINVNKIIYEGKPAICTIVRDITERRRYEQELIAAKNAAEESTKLKSAFLANLSHEIRTPLNGIMGFTEMLISKDLKESKRQEFAKYIKECSEKLLTIVEDILHVSFIQSGQVELNSDLFSLNNMVNNLVVEFGYKPDELDKKIELKTVQSLRDGEDIVSADSEKIHLVFSKLLDNAFKFTKEGVVEFGYTLTDNNSVEFFVKDTGIGVPEDSLNKLFESFRQFDQGVTRKFEGLGLGLSIVKGVVNQLGGTIAIESEVDKGSFVTFSIPVKFSEEPVLNAEYDVYIADLKEKSILVVDDEVMHYELVKEYLYETEAKLIHAETGAEALEKLQYLHQVDLIILDIRMPGMNGIETFKNIRTINADIPIIALTVYASENDRKSILNAGFTDYLSKPVAKDQLVEVIRKLIQD